MGGKLRVLMVVICSMGILTLVAGQADPEACYRKVPCTQDKEVADPENCSAYYLCDNNKWISRPCAPGSKWDYIDNACIAEASARCHPPCPSTTPTTTQTLGTGTVPTTPEWGGTCDDITSCTTGERYADKLHANKYYQCVHGMLDGRVCGGTMLFNIETGLCDHDYNVDPSYRCLTTARPSTTEAMTTTEMTTISITTTESVSTPTTGGVSTPDLTTTEIMSTPIVTTTEVLSTPDITTTEIISTPDHTTTENISTPDNTTTENISTPDLTTTGITSTPDLTTTEIMLTPDLTTIGLLSTPDLTTTQRLSTPDLTTRDTTTPYLQTTEKMTTPSLSPGPPIDLQTILIITAASTSCLTLVIVSVTCMIVLTRRRRHRAHRDRCSSFSDTTERSEDFDEVLRTVSAKEHRMHSDHVTMMFRPALALDTRSVSRCPSEMSSPGSPPTSPDIPLVWNPIFLGRKVNKKLFD